jgi:hypothetical protein
LGLSIFMAFQNLVFKEEDEVALVQPSRLPPNVLSDAKAGQKSEPPKPVATQSGQFEKPNPGVKADVIHEHEIPNRQPDGIKPYSKEFLATTGMLVLGNQVLLPRQVMPFCKGWSFSREISYIRWQIVLHLQEVECDGRRCQLLRPVAANEHSIFAHRRSYMVSVRPDGCAGFTGKYFSPGRQFTIDDAERFHNLNSFADRTLEDINFKSSVASILPVFYWDIGQDTVNQIRCNQSSLDASCLRQVFDLKTQSWRWMYQLGGQDSRSPVVFSDRPGLATEEIGGLHSVFGGFNLVCPIYIGGCGIYPGKLDINFDTSSFEKKHRGVIEGQADTAEIFAETSAYKFKAAVFPIPTERFQPKKKNSKESEKPREELQAAEIRKIVNGPAISMVERIHGRPTIPGF